MEFSPQDQDIITLLTKLRDTAGIYPEHMFAARRQSFLNQMTAIGLGIGAATGIKNVQGKAPGTSPFTNTLLKIVLITAVIIETGAVAYFYREKLADFLQTITKPSEIEEVPSPETQNVSPSPVATATSASVTPVIEPAIIVVTPTGTAISIPGNSLEVSQPSATSDPKGNSGNHYGQTPKPERTKENSGNDKPPKEKDDKPPKEKEDKPPKDK